MFRCRSALKERYTLKLQVYKHRKTLDSHIDCTV
uniref:Uncharacterized protein n=1 Tax=Anguilla anguilla TaxID=7936 RepID=A0A0E9UXE6_ANGAN